MGDDEKELNKNYNSNVSSFSEENDKQNYPKNKTGKFSIFFRIFLFLIIFNFVISFLVNFAFDNLENKKLDFLVGSEVSTIDSETTAVCVDYHPVYDKYGKKSYKVDFRTIGDDNVFFNSIVDAKEVDEKHNIEKDAEYDCVITYTYINKAFELVDNDFTDEEVNEIILSAIHNEKEFRRFYSVSKIDFMYGDGVIDNNEETAMEKLNQFIKSETELKAEEKAEREQKGKIDFKKNSKNDAKIKNALKQK